MFRILLSFLWLAITSNAFAQEPHVVFTKEEASPQQLQSFRKALISAAESSYRDGEISRLDVFKIRVASLNKEVLKKMHATVVEQASFEGKAEPAKVDWSTLLTFIKELLPIILELIKLFS